MKVLQILMILQILMKVVQVHYDEGITFCDEGVSCDEGIISYNERIISSDKGNTSCDKCVNVMSIVHTDYKLICRCSLCLNQCPG